MNPIMASFSQLLCACFNLAILGSLKLSRCAQHKRAGALFPTRWCAERSEAEIWKSAGGRGVLGRGRGKNLASAHRTAWLWELIAVKSATLNERAETLLARSKRNNDRLTFYVQEGGGYNKSWPKRALLRIETAQTAHIFCKCTRK